MIKRVIIVALFVLLHARVAPTQTPTSAEALDRLLAPIALYPDQLLAQMLLSAQNPGQVEALRLWLDKNQSLKGSDLQDAAVKQGFEASLVVLVLFPQVVRTMSDQLDWTTNLGVAFTADRSAVFASIQRLRKQASDVGTLKSTAQQEVKTQMTSAGEQVIVIEPANPQVVYVPQYNTTTVYTQPPSTTVVVVEDDDDSDVVAAGMIGFTAGIAMGAAVNNSYYYGPYGWYGGGYMYNDAWDDYADAREDARDDWMDHREDLVEERGDRAENAREERTERTETRSENRPESQAQRTERQENRPQATEAQRQQAQTAATEARSSGGGSAARGQSSGGTKTTQQRSGTSSDAFSGYSSGKSERAASARGQQSRSSGGRSSAGRGGGGGRRR